MGVKQDMSKQPKDTGVKKLTRFISQSSQRLFSSFLDEETGQEKHLSKIHKSINQAISNKSLVVLQYQDPKQEHYETLVGKLYQHAINPNALVIKLQKNNEVRMISAKYIKKISLIQAHAPRQVSIS